MAWSIGSTVLQIGISRCSFGSNFLDFDGICFPLGSNLIWFELALLHIINIYINDASIWRLLSCISICFLQMRGAIHGVHCVRVSECRLFQAISILFLLNPSAYFQLIWAFLIWSLIWLLISFTFWQFRYLLYRCFNEILLDIEHIRIFWSVVLFLLLHCILINVIIKAQQ